MKQDLNEKYKDLLGHELSDSHLTLIKILDETSTDGAFSRMCLAKCRCGKIIKRKLCYVLSRHIRSCGECGYKSKRVSDACLNDLTGKTFGNLFVIRRSDPIGGNKAHRSARYECKCLYKGCGNHLFVRSDEIQNGSVSSCGKCGYEQDRKLRRTARAIPITDEKAIKRRFSGMRQRCYNPKSIEYSNYGARGVVICDEWLKDRKKFVEWSLKNGFRQDLTIERLNEGVYHENQDGPYAPWNCAWIPREKQSLNTRLCRFIDVAGIPKPISECSRILGIDPRRGSEMTDEEISKKTTREYLGNEFGELFN